MQQSRFYQNQARVQPNQTGYAQPFAPAPHQRQTYNPATAWNPAPLQPQMQTQPFQAPPEQNYQNPFNAHQPTHMNPTTQPWQAPTDAPFVYFGEGEKEKSTLVRKQTSTEKTAIYSFIERFKKDWTTEELNFSMNKISMAGLIFGLMFLGSLFFLIGFLVAVNLYDKKPDPLCATPKVYMPTQGAVLSGQAGTIMPMSTPIPHTPRMAQPQSGLGMQSGRMPTTMQQARPDFYQGQGRAPSFQVR